MLFWFEMFGGSILLASLGFLYVFTTATEDVCPSAFKVWFVESIAILTSGCYLVALYSLIKLIIEIVKFAIRLV